MDLAFILDQSTSIGEDWSKVVSFLEAVVNSLSVSQSQTRVAISRFNEASFVEFKLDRWNTKQQIIDAIKAINYEGGNTNIAAGLRITRTGIFGQSGDRSDVTNVAVLFTDGIANTEAGAIDTEAAELKKVASVVTIGVTNAVDQDQLKKIASSPSLFVYAANFDALAGISGELANLACAATKIGNILSD
jgi:hypothetical protein